MDLRPWNSKLCQQAGRNYLLNIDAGNKFAVSSTIFQEHNMYHCRKSHYLTQDSESLIVNFIYGEGK